MDVEIILPTMNRPKNLRLSLESLIVNSGYPIKRIIVVDSSVSELSRKVIDIASAIKNKYGIDVKVLHQNPKGLSAAINLGIQHADSDIIIKVDDDIVYGKNWLRKIIDVLIEDKAIGCCFVRVLPMKNDAYSKLYSAVLGMDKGKKKVVVTPKDISIRTITRAMREAIKMKLTREKIFKGYVIPPFVGYIVQAFRKKALESIGFYDENLGLGTPAGGGEELDIVYRLLKSGWKVAYVGSSVVYHDCSRQLGDILKDALESGTSKRALVSKYIRKKDPYMLILGFMIFINLLVEFFLIRPKNAFLRALKLIKAVELYGFLTG